MFPALLRYVEYLLAAGDVVTQSLLHHPLAAVVSLGHRPVAFQQSWRSPGHDGLHLEEVTGALGNTMCMKVNDMIWRVHHIYLTQANCSCQQSVHQTWMLSLFYSLKTKLQVNILMPKSKETPNVGLQVDLPQFPLGPDLQTSDLRQGRSTGANALVLLLSRKIFSAKDHKKNNKSFV